MEEPERLYNLYQFAYNLCFEVYLMMTVTSYYSVYTTAAPGFIIREKDNMEPRDICVRTVLLSTRFCKTNKKEQKIA